MRSKIAIFGSGGFGREVLQLIRDVNVSQATWTCVGFIVDSGFSSQTLVHGLPVLGGIEWLEKNPDVDIVVAVGSSSTRFKIVRNIRDRCQNNFATLVHPRAWIGENVKLGAGSIVCAGALITTDIEISEHVQVNIGATIGHDAQLCEFVTLNPGVNVSGNVTLKEGVEVGTGSVIIPGCVIGGWSIVGAGSVVTKPIAGNCTAVGAPSRVIKERSSGWQND